MPPSTSPSWTPATAAASVALFLAAALAEVGGGWLVWQGVVPPRRPHPAAWVAGGLVLLAAYGFIPTAQPLVAPAGHVPFGRVFAVDGGAFILVSYGAGWALDGVRPDAGDGVGAAIALVGVGVAWFWRR